MARKALTRRITVSASRIVATRLTLNAPADLSDDALDDWVNDEACRVVDAMDSWAYGVVGNHTRGTLDAIELNETVDMRDGWEREKPAVKEAPDA